MRITPLELLLGTPRLQRRINAELAQLPHDIAAIHANAEQLKQGVASKVTSLPALALAATSGFVVAKLAHSSRLQNDISTFTGSLAWQLLMPLAFGWMQTMLASTDTSDVSTDQ